MRQRLKLCIGDLLSLEYGKSLPQSERYESGAVLVAGSNGPVGHHDRALVEGPGIVVGRKGSAGKIAWFDSDFFPIDTTFYVRLRMKAVLKWVYYLLESLQLERLRIVTGVPGLNREDVYKVPFDLPTPSEQRRIAEILDQAEELRRLRAEADAKAAKIIPALFYDMFGDPATNPKGWSVSKLGDPAVTLINPRFGRDDLNDDLEVSFVPMADVDQVSGRISGWQSRVYSEVRKGFTPFKDGDLLFAKITPCMQNGKAAIASDLVNGIGFGSTEFHVLRPGNLASVEWLFGLVRLSRFRKLAEAAFTGSAGQQRVPKQFLENFEVPLPPMALQKKFGEKLKAIHQMTLQRETVAGSIQLLFDSLLHKAFSGELTEQWRKKNASIVEEELRHMRQVLKSDQSTDEPLRKAYKPVKRQPKGKKR